MKLYSLDTTLTATFQVKAETLGEAKRKLRRALDGVDANFGMLDNQPLGADVSIEGLIDCEEDDAIECDDKGVAP